MLRFLAVILVCLTASVGCNRSNDAEVARLKADAEAAKAKVDEVIAQSKAETEAAKAEATKVAQAQSKVDADRRAAEWALSIKGSAKITTNGVEST